MSDITVTLRACAVTIERWSHHSMISCALSDEMEDVASKLRAIEKRIAGTDNSESPDSEKGKGGAK
jgi:hypothetical protein